jgi:hypothetical protein
MGGGFAHTVNAQPRTVGGRKAGFVCKLPAGVGKRRLREFSCLDVSCLAPFRRSRGGVLGVCRARDCVVARACREGVSGSATDDDRRRFLPDAQPSPDYAGYVIGQDFTSGALTTTVVVPRIKHCTRATRAIVPGAGVLAGNSNTNTGGLDLAGVFVGCLQGKARYFPIPVLQGHEKDYSTVKIQPGDKVVLSAGGNSTSSRVSIVDKTHKGANENRVGPSVNEVNSPAVFDWPWVQGVFLLLGGQPPPPVGVPNFGKVHFSASAFARKPLNSSNYASVVYAFNRYSYSQQTGSPEFLQIATTPFASDDESFTTVFEHP